MKNIRHVIVRPSPFLVPVRILTKYNLRVPQDTVFFRHLPHNKPHSDWLVLGLWLDPR